MQVHRLIALSLCGGGAMLAATVASAQVVAVDTFGPGNAFNQNASHQVRGSASPAGNFLGQGYLFTAEASGTVEQIVTALEHLDGVNDFTIEIRMGDANQVGQAIGIWTSVQGGSAADPVITISSGSVIGPAELTQGQTYWILATGTDTATGRWFQRHTNITPSTYWGQSYDNINWYLVNSSQLRAMRIVLEGEPTCYANCDGSTTEPILNVDDFTCFINEFASAQSLSYEQQVAHYANCDGSTTAPVLNVDDFTCFINAFAQGCP